MRIRYLLWRLREEFFPPKHPFDVSTGCDTSGMMHRKRLGAEATDYQPIDPDVFRATISHIHEDFSCFTFVDFGCGKGRALLLAEHVGFDKIVGVEFSRRLARIARANAATMDSQRITVIDQDAREFAFPSSPLVVFLYNPFSGDILRSTMSKLRSRREIAYIAYVNPMHADVVSSELGIQTIAADDWCAIWKWLPHEAAVIVSDLEFPASVAKAHV
jgi:SAM-dependent methyltransferase